MKFKFVHTYSPHTDWVKTKTVTSDMSWSLYVWEQNQRININGEIVEDWHYLANNQSLEQLKKEALFYKKNKEDTFEMEI